MRESGRRKTFDPSEFRQPVNPEIFGDFTINPEFANLLSKSGFTDFDSVFHFDGGEVFKRIKDRSVAKIEVFGEDGPKSWYLKRHEAELIDRGVRLFPECERLPETQGLLEFRNIVDFRKSGLACVNPVAAGEKRIGGSKAVSFLITEDFSPFVSLEWLLFNRPDYFTGPGAEERKKVLMERIGRFAAKMHEAGFNHKDFNATHILLGFRENLSGPPEIALFDLQRVDRKKLFRFRWIVKSLAELNYTLLKEYFGAEERANLFLACKGTDNPGLYGRFQQFWIRRKTERIARHTENLMKRRRAGK